MTIEGILMKFSIAIVLCDIMRQDHDAIPIMSDVQIVQFCPSLYVLNASKQQ